MLIILASMNQLEYTKNLVKITEDIFKYKALLKEGGRILCFDYGKSATGLSISDDKKRIALGLSTLSKDTFKKFINKIENIVNSKNIMSFIVGLPLNKDGSKGPRAQSAITFASLLYKTFNKPILLWDERFSTKGVENQLSYAKVSKKLIKKNIDTASATWILQSALDALIFVEENDA